MKKLIILMSITINFLYGCSNDQYDITEELSLSEAQNLARNHLSIEGEKYVLNLTREEQTKWEYQLMYIPNSFMKYMKSMIFWKIFE